MNKWDGACRVKEDLTGRRYGRLTVIARGEDYLKPRGKRFEKVPRWVCKCDCGNIALVKGYNLKCGETASCGCLHRDTARKQGKSNTIDLSGRRFGKLVAIEIVKIYTSPKGATRPVWRCKCDCGNETEVTYGSLVNGVTRSCGCLKHRYGDYTGKRFGKLTAIERVGVHNAGKSRHGGLWWCVCDCGREKIVPITQLLSGNAKSCGCLKSMGETLIEDYLKRHDINHEKEFSFIGTDIEDLRYDFALMNNGEVAALVEYDGAHHYMPVKFGGCSQEQADANFKRQLYRDKLKTEFCQQNNIPLLRIPYWEEKDTQIILEDFIQGMTRLTGGIGVIDEQHLLRQ